MIKYLFNISYWGFNFLGSQSQLNFNTIEDIFQYNFFLVFKNILKINLSSRTDKNVSCFSQIIDINSFFLKKSIFFKKKFFNKFIFLISFKQIFKNFHSRFSCLSRLYSYVFYLKKNFLFVTFFKYLNFKFNLYFFIFFFKNILGLNNFLILDSFYKKNKKYLKIIYEIIFLKFNNFFYILIKGNSFLYKMIRNLISYLFYFISYNLNLFFFFNLYYYKIYNFFIKSFDSNSLYLIKTNYPLLFNIL